MAQSTQDKDETGVLLFQVAAAAFILGQNEAVALRCCSSSTNPTKLKQFSNLSLRRDLVNISVGLSSDAIFTSLIAPDSTTS
ncbi:hypothetical protein D0Y65_012706 [Glycine soja]|uniref:Uncharacterized protein n=1 Tax=Glycine soja TaxID=3848 RepID=A0A445KQW5_GLYSO|nr:hypothetical protein D0Y65_012706 [Glycine soja]